MSNVRARVNEIDLLRFVAAMSVVMFHYAFRGHAADGLSALSYPWLAGVAKYGYLGVQLFFIISGFVILMTADSASLRSFAVSRVVRLYPAFWACCTLTFVLTLLLGAPVYSARPGQYAANMTMFSGFFDVTSIDGSYWSLFVEMKFYGLVALVLLARQIRRAESLLYGWLMLSIVAEAAHIGHLRSWLITEYSAYFIAGALMFLVWSRSATPARLLGIAVCAILAVWQSIRALPGLEQHYHTTMSPVVVGGAVMSCFGVLLLVALRWTGPLASRRWVAAGAMTYPLYLLHQNIGFMLFNALSSALNVHVLFWGTIGLMLGSAYAVHVLIEKPYARAFKNLLSGSRAAPSPVVRRFPTPAAAAAAEPKRELA